jgi:polar amino acid transport system substrate-binding protein
VAGTRFENVTSAAPTASLAAWAYDLLRLFAQRYGYRLRFDIYPWRRAQELINSAKADVLVSPYKTPERTRTMLFSGQAFAAGSGGVLRARRCLAAVGGRLRMLRGRRIVTLNGWNYGQAFSKAAPQLNIRVTNSVESG